MTIITDIAAALAVDAFADEDGYTAHLCALSEEAHREGRRTVELLLAVLADEPDEVRAARADDVRRAGLASHPDTAERGLLLCAADVLDAEGRAIEGDVDSIECESCRRRCARLGSERRIDDARGAHSVCADCVAHEARAS